MLRAKLQHPDLVTIREHFEHQKAFQTDGTSASGEPDEAIRQKIENLAFTYLLDSTHEAEAGRKAIRLLQHYLPSIKTVEGYHPNAHAYQSVLTAAMVYDWCYNLLSSEDRKELIDAMLRVSCLAEYCIFKNTPKQYLSGHYGEYAPTVFLAMGIAIYNERQDVFDFAYKEQVSKFAPSRNFWYPSGAHHQGSQYLHVRYGQEIFQAYMLDKLGLNPYLKEMALVAYRDLYAQVPQATDMDGMPEGDCHNNITMGNNYLEFMPLSASMSADPFLQSYAKLHLNQLKDIPTRALLFYNPALPATTFDKLCLSRFFPSPSGLLIARTGWDLHKRDLKSNAMIVLMNMREYSAKNHVHLDIGHFGIFYKGHLALDAGIYQGKDPNNGWGKKNYVNYYARTIAHNSLLIYDPNEPTPYEGSNVKATSRDGGQFSFKNRAWDSTQEMVAAGKGATIIAHEISAGTAPDYSYLMGDMTRAYNVPVNVATYPAKADTVRRSFIFINLFNQAVPGALIVMDRVVATNPAFKKTWLLHTQNEPQIAGNTITASNTTDGRNGKLVNTVCLPLPQNVRIEKVGGPGKEFWVDSTNWGTETQQDAGEWRIELSPKNAARSDNFLNVLQAMDATGNAKPLPVTTIESTNGNYVAVMIGKYIVAQHRLLCENEQSIVFVLPALRSPAKLLVTNLKAGTWTISNNGKITSRNVNPSAGTIYITTRGGKVVLKMKVEETSPSQ